MRHEPLDNLWCETSGAAAEIQAFQLLRLRYIGPVAQAENRIRRLAVIHRHDLEARSIATSDNDARNIDETDVRSAGSTA